MQLNLRNIRGVNDANNAQVGGSVGANSAINDIYASISKFCQLDYNDMKVPTQTDDEENPMQVYIEVTGFRLYVHSYMYRSG